MPEEIGNTVLDDIISARRQALEETRLSVPPARVEQMAEARKDRRDFAAALSDVGAPGGGPALRVIAELKRASPSRGLLRHKYRRREIALGYAAAGASAISVLTEEQYFLGRLQDVTDVHEAVELPVLRKDFIVDGYQVYESVAAGADALLLIVAALAGRELHDLLGLCHQLQIAALVEVHTQDELKRAIDVGARIIGVNNRNLKTLEVDLETSFNLRAKMPRDCIAVSESGIKTAENLRRIREAGFNAVLIGERLMAQGDPGGALRDLLAEFARERASRKSGDPQVQGSLGPGRSPLGEEPLF